MSNVVKGIKNDNRDLLDDMDSSYKKVAKQMMEYISSFDLSTYNKEKVNRDIYAMILDGQRRGEDIQQIIGGDYRRFCDEILKEVERLTPSQKKLKMISTVVTYIFAWILMLFMYKVTDMLYTGDYSNMLIITLSDLLTSFGYAILTSALAKMSNRFAFHRSRLYVYMICIFCLYMIIQIISEANGNVSVCSVPILFMFVLLVLIFIVSMLLYKKVERIGINDDRKYQK